MLNMRGKKQTIEKCAKILAKYEFKAADEAQDIKSIQRNNYRALDKHMKLLHYYNIVIDNLRKYKLKLESDNVTENDILKCLEYIDNVIKNLQ